MKTDTRSIKIYTIIYTAADADRGIFHNPEARGSYLSLTSAQSELERQITAEKAELDSRYDCEERENDSWEVYQDGYAAACFARIEILTSILHEGRTR